MKATAVGSICAVVVCAVEYGLYILLIFSALRFMTSTAWLSEHSTQQGQKEASNSPSHRFGCCNCSNSVGGLGQVNEAPSTFVIPDLM